MSHYQFNYEPTHQHMLIKIHKTQFESNAVHEFKTMLDSNWNQDARGATVDCADVKYIDSMGIGALLCVHKRVQRSGGCVRLINAQRNVVEVIELLKLNSIFQVECSHLN